MSKDFSDCYRQYIHLSEAYYAKAVLQGTDYIDRVTFYLTGNEDGTAGEMCVKWYTIGRRAAPILECYDDGWAALATFKDVIDAMAEVDDQGVTPKQFCEILDTLGFKDETPREQEG